MFEHLLEFFPDSFFPRQLDYIVLFCPLFYIKCYRSECFFGLFSEISSGLYEFIGIFRIRKGYDVDIQIFIIEIFKTLEGGLNSCLISVETKIQLLGEPFYERDMFLGQSSPAYTNGIIYACLVECNCVHLTFDDDDTLFFGNSTLRQMKSVEDGTFIEDIRNRGIEILGLSFVDDAPRESDGISCKIGDREDDAPVELITSWSDKYPGIDDILFRKALVLHSGKEFAWIS